MARLDFIGSLKEVNAHVHLEVHVIEEKNLICYTFLWGCEIAALQFRTASLCHSRTSNSDPTPEICPRQQNWSEFVQEHSLQAESNQGVKRFKGDEDKQVIP